MDSKASSGYYVEGERSHAVADVVDYERFGIGRSIAVLLPGREHLNSLGN